MTDDMILQTDLSVFETLESNVRSYSRSFPTVFSTASGAILTAEDGREFIDFLAGAGALNYGHNNPEIGAAVLDYLGKGGIVHALDMATSAKRAFIEAFHSAILQPRRMSYRLQFSGPTGANAVEAAFKLARKVTGRHNVLSFTNGYHGMSLGAMAATGNRDYRAACGIPVHGADVMPYDGYLGTFDTATYLEKVLADPSSGIDHPAAIIVETIQGEGGINVASPAWLRSIENICRSFGILLIVDDIQMGCGRTGEFFSFEDAALSPDIIVLSKSLSGFGLPLSVVLIRPELDQWKPGEHTGTFRGNNLALVAATAAVDRYWRDDRLRRSTQRKGRSMRSRLNAIAARHADQTFAVRGRGMVLGFDCGAADLAKSIARRAFQLGLIIERCGPEDQVIKFIPPITIEDDVLDRGLSIFETAVSDTIEIAAAAAPRRSHA